MAFNSSQLILAFKQTLRRLLRKLPIIILAAIACYGLYYFDKIKGNYDGAKAQVFIIEGDYRTKLKESVEEKGGEKGWNVIETYLMRANRPFGNTGDLVNQLNEEVTARKNKRIKDVEDVETARLKVCIAIAQNPDSAGSQTKELAGVGSRVNDCFAKYVAEVKDITDVANYDASSARSKINNYIASSELENIRKSINNQARIAQAGNGKAPTQSLEDFLQPTLNDKSGLYIIYQILRITFIITIVFSLIVVISLLFRTMLVTDSATTLTEQAKSLINIKESAVPSAAKTAIISIAALGVGTAVAAGVAINDKADRALSFNGDGGYSSYATAGWGRAREGGDRTGPGSNDLGSSGQGQGQGEDLGKDEGLLGSNLPPQIYVRVPATRVIQYPVVPDAKTSQELSTYLTSSSGLMNIMAEKIKNITQPIPSTDIKVANRQPVGAPEADALKVDLVGLIKDVPGNDAIKIPATPSLGKRLADLQDSFKKLDNVNTSLENIRKTSWDRPLKPQGRNFFTRLFSKDYYVASPQALEKLRDIMQVGASPPTILEALNSLSTKGNAPLEEEAFLKKVEEELRNLPEIETQPVPPAASIKKRLSEESIKTLLKDWKRTILNFTRVP